MSKKLKHCPFCGGIPKLCKHIESIGPYIIHDMQDEKQTVCPLARSSYSLDEWNTRATPDHTELLLELKKAFLNIQDYAGDMSTKVNSAWENND